MMVKKACHHQVLWIHCWHEQLDDPCTHQWPTQERVKWWQGQAMGSSGWIEVGKELHMFQGWKGWILVVAAHFGFYPPSSAHSHPLPLHGVMSAKELNSWCRAAEIHRKSGSVLGGKYIGAAAYYEWWGTRLGC